MDLQIWTSLQVAEPTVDNVEQVENALSDLDLFERAVAGGVVQV